MKPKITDIIDGTRYEFDSAEEMWFAWWLEELKRHGVIVSWQYHAKTWQLSRPCNLSWFVQGARKLLQKSKSLLRAHSYTADFTVQWKDDRFVNVAVPPEAFNARQSNHCSAKQTVSEYALHLIDKGPANPTNPWGQYNEKAVMIAANEHMICYVDVKGGFTRGHSKSESFETKRGQIWDQYGEYINRVVPYTSAKKKTYDAETQEPMDGGGKPCLFRDTFYPQRFMLTDKGHSARKIHGPVRRIEEWLSR